jgi:hypothetical protein
MLAPEAKNGCLVLSVTAFGFEAVIDCWTIREAAVSHRNEPRIFGFYTPSHGARGSVVVKALCYKPEGRGFETR